MKHDHLWAVKRITKVLSEENMIVTWTWPRPLCSQFADGSEISLQQAVVGKNIVDCVSVRAEEHLWRPWWRRRALLANFRWRKKHHLVVCERVLKYSGEEPVQELNHPHQIKGGNEWWGNLEGFGFEPKPSAKLNFELCNFQPGPKLISSSPFLTKRFILYPS